MDTRARLRGVPPWLPIALLIIVGLVCIGTPLGALKPTPASLMSVGLGFVAGTAIRVQHRCAGPVIGWYAGWQLLVPLLLGRPVPAAITAVVIGTITVVALTVAGRAIGLRRLAEPTDVLRLTLLALLAAAILPLLAAMGAQQLGIDTGVAGNLAQAVLAGAAGVVVGGGFALTFRVRRPGHVTGPRVLELVGVVAVTVLLLVAVTTSEAHSISSSGPLIVLIVALGWAAMRFGPRVSAALVAVSALWIATVTVRGSGVFADTERSRIDALLSAQGYIVVTSIGILTLAVYAYRVRTQDAEAGRSAEILYNALDGAAAQMFLKRYDRATDRFVYFDVNDALAGTLDLTPADFLGRASEDLYEGDLARRFREQDDEILRTGTRLRFDTTWVVRGNVTSNMTTMFPLRDAAGEVIGVGGVSLDRTEEIHREQMLQLMFNRSPVPTARLQWLGDGLGDVIEVNPAFADLLGVAAQDIEGRPLSDVVSTTELSGATLPTGGTDQREVRLRRRDGVELTVLVTGTLVGDDEPGQEPFLLIIVQDVTDTRAAEAGLVHRATHDPLTDLLNRQALVERLSMTTHGTGTVPPGMALLCCDVDGFKSINDSLGHETGDRVLLAVADRVREAAGPDATVARLGADEFVVVRSGTSTAADAQRTAERIRGAVAAALTMDGREHRLRVSIGIAISNGSVGAEDLLRQGDVALTRAKDAGRDRIEEYRADLDRRVQMRMAMRETLSQALSENRIEAHLQPVIELSTGRTVGAEALVRLRDLDGTLLPPVAFIPVAEESGLIGALGLRVLDISLAMSRRWSEAATPIAISVNVSPRQLSDETLPATVASLLGTHGVDPADVTLEVTESSVVDAVGPTLRVLQRLRDSGLHIAIDDFGTGYSSLSSLRHLPADIVKVDRSFVAGLGGQDSDEAIVRAVLAMAHATDRVVVAEGVETEQQAHRLLELGCDRVQGFLYSAPVPAIAFDPRHRYPVPSRIADGGDQPYPMI